MAEGEGGGQSSLRRLSWNLRQSMPVNMNLPTAGRIQGNLGRMVQGILPELQQEYLISVGGGPQHHAHVRAPQPPGDAAYGGRHVPVGAGQEAINMDQSGAGPAVVIDMSDGAAAPADLSGAAPAQNVPDENQNVPPHAHAHNAPGGEAANRISLRTLMKGVEGSLVFILLALAKIMYDHRLGILVFVGLFGTFYHANSSLKKYITQRELSRHINILWILAFLVCNIGFLYYVFADQELYRSLIMQLPQVPHMEVWNLMWIVAITDFVIKFAVIAVKCGIALLPRQLLAVKRRGRYYMMLEYSSQFYRSLTPIRPWVHFLLDDMHGGEWFSLLLLGIYAACKSQQLLAKAKELKIVFTKFRSDVSYGMCASHEELKESDNTCPICQDTFHDPVKLHCKHIFCEDCVSMWFDRERTCPMCRANIVDNPLWRDGSTSAALQLY